MQNTPSVHVKRADFHRRLEPVGDLVLHGAGQDTGTFVGSSSITFDDYWGAIGEHKPSLYMTYCGLNRDIVSYFRQLQLTLDNYLPNRILPQIGLHMTGDALDDRPEEHYEHEVAEGRFDEQIRTFCDGLRSLGRPAYVRIGFEFNGPWNGYDPEAYKKAWVRIVTALRRYRLEDVAAVWCYCPLPSSREEAWGVDRDYLPYYPGDEWVDWWAIDLFSPDNFAMHNTRWFIQDAEQRHFPVMIGESTPRWVGGVQTGEAAWNAWFKPYFGFIHSFRTVKAFCYINWNWTEYPPWSDWGDARIQENEAILERYRREMTSPLYVHASPDPYPIRSSTQFTDQG